AARVVVLHRLNGEDLMHVFGRPVLDDDALGPVGRAGVAVDEDRPEVGEILDEPGLCRPHAVATSRGTLEARDADHNVGPAEEGDLVAHGRRQRSGHVQTVPLTAAVASGRRWARWTLRSALTGL